MFAALSAGNLATASNIACADAYYKWRQIPTGLAHINPMQLIPIKINGTLLIPMNDLSNSNYYNVLCPYNREHF